MKNKQLPKESTFSSVADICINSDPKMEAWLYHFLTENNLEYLLSPSLVSSPEQLRFMVALKEGQIYVPCSDDMFFKIYNKDKNWLKEEYQHVWDFIVSLVQSYHMDDEDREHILSFCRYRFETYQHDWVLLPSRLTKRLVSIVTTQRNDRDPYYSKKVHVNSLAVKNINDLRTQKALYNIDYDNFAATDIISTRWNLDIEEITRKIILSTYRPAWDDEPSEELLKDELKASHAKCKVLSDVFCKDFQDSKKILFIPDVAGALIFDLSLIKVFLRLGYQVILAVKSGFYFNSPTIADFEMDHLLRDLIEDANLLYNENVTKNELLQLLREHRFVVISDGTSEQLNLYRTSTSFARAWKECDIIIAKGKRNKSVLIDSSLNLTRDCLCYWREPSGEFKMSFKPKASWVKKVNESYILGLSKRIIESMKQARSEDKTIMFYSAIIGSIPGQTKLAIDVVNTFVAYLRDRQDHVFIINPAEYFEEGLDGDDLMYMWEHVQRSGLLNVWRFQTFSDIEKSFTLMGKKVPSVWLGKDSTFSTGCTKEMRIALDVQKKHPELQIIGPASNLFFRRQDYGIGKYFDESL